MPEVIQSDEATHSQSVSTLIQIIVLLLSKDIYGIKPEKWKLCNSN